MFRVAFWLVAAAAISGCGAERQRSKSALRDDAGYSFDSQRRYRRIVSLSPATTELLFDLGAGPLVVGRTRYCEDPPEVIRVPSVGEGFSPNVEAIAARRPDLVVFYHSSANQPAVERLRAMGIATLSLRIDRLADLSRAARLLGTATHQTRRADSLVERLEINLDSLRHQAMTTRYRPSVAIVVWDNPPIVIGSQSFLSEIAQLAGAENVFADLARPSATVNLETLAARDPDFLVVFENGSGEGFLRRPEWQAVRAVRERRVVRLSGSEFGHPSLRAPRAVRRLRELLNAERHKIPA